MRFFKKLAVCAMLVSTFCALGAAPAFAKEQLTEEEVLELLLEDLIQQQQEQVTCYQVAADILKCCDRWGCWYEGRRPVYA